MKFVETSMWNLCLTMPLPWILDVLASVNIWYGSGPYALCHAYTNAWAERSLGLEPFPGDVSVCRNNTNTNLLLLCNLCSFYDIKVFRELFLFRSGIGSLDYVLIQCSLFYFISYLVLSNKVQGHRPSSLRVLWQRRSRSNKTIRHAIVVQHSACWSDLQSLCCPISSWKNRRQRDDGNVSSPPRGLQYGQCLATDPPSFK